MESEYKAILGEIKVEGTVMNPDSDARHNSVAEPFPPKLETHWEATTIESPYGERI